MLWACPDIQSSVRCGSCVLIVDSMMIQMDMVLCTPPVWCLSIRWPVSVCAVSICPVSPCTVSAMSCMVLELELEVPFLLMSIRISQLGGILSQDTSLCITPRGPGDYAQLGTLAIVLFLHRMIVMTSHSSWMTDFHPHSEGIRHLADGLC